MSAWLERYQLSGRDVGLAVLVLLAVFGLGTANYVIACRMNNGKDALRVQVITTRPLFPGTTIAKTDVAVRLRPESSRGFSHVDQVINRRAARFIQYGSTLTAGDLDNVAAVSGRTKFVVKISPTHSMNAAPGTWITLVRSGQNPPMPIGLFHVCSRIPVDLNLDAVTLEACQTADAIAVLSKAGTGEWIPIPVDAKRTCL